MPQVGMHTLQTGDKSPENLHLVRGSQRDTLPHLFVLRKTYEVPNGLGSGTIDRLITPHCRGCLVSLYLLAERKQAPNARSPWQRRHPFEGTTRVPA